jgi:subtilisin family serine protease
MLGPRFWLQVFVVFVCASAINAQEKAAAVNAAFPAASVSTRTFVSDPLLRPTGIEASSVRTIDRARTLYDRLQHARKRAELGELAALNTAREVEAFASLAREYSAEIMSSPATLSASTESQGHLKESSAVLAEHRRKQDALRAERQMVVQSEEQLAAATRELKQVTDAPEFAMAFRAGIPVDPSAVIVQFVPAATIAEMKRLFDDYELTPTVISAELLLFRCEFRHSVPAGWATLELHRVLRLLRTESRVLTAYPNTALEGQVLPSRALVPTDRCLSYADVCTPNGTAALRVMNFPSAWNFRDAMKRYGATNIGVGVLDTGFGSHEDLRIQQVQGCATRVVPAAVDHGNHVAGIIGATFNNGIGIDGACPVAQLYGCAVPGVARGDAVGRVVAFDVAMLHLLKLMSATNIRVINLSLGYNWLEMFTNADDDPYVQALVRDQGITSQSLAHLARTRGIIFVTAAGNDSVVAKDQPGFANVSARFASPFNWAAIDKSPLLDPQPNIIVVESVSLKGARSEFSNVGGSLSAPGEDIYSLSGSDGQYTAQSGTSMAAPYVAALVAMMFAYNPALSADEVVNRLGVVTPSARVPAPMPNAFRALILARPEQALKHLADLNNDTLVDMADFNLFVNAMKAVEAKSYATDLNEDGIVDSSEDMYPRADLNGSGVLSRDPADVREMRPGEYLTDLEVMQSAWEDATVPAGDLPALLKGAFK